MKIRIIIDMFTYKDGHSNNCITVRVYSIQCHTVYPEILAVIKFGDFPEIW